MSYLCFVRACFVERQLVDHMVRQTLSPHM